MKKIKALWQNYKYNIYAFIIWLILFLIECWSSDKGFITALKSNIVNQLIYGFAFQILAWMLKKYKELSHAFDLENGKVFQILTNWSNNQIQILENWSDNQFQILDKWVDNQKREIPGIVEKNFSKTIADFTAAHKGFINDIYYNCPHPFTPFFDPNKKELKEGGLRSLYIWFEKITVGEYSDFATKLLNYTRNSVYSTTYFDNFQLIDKLGDDNSKVLEWLRQVNKKRANDKLQKIVRVHIFKKEEYIDKNDEKKEIVSLRDFDDFIKRLNEKPVAKENYKNLYIIPADEYYTWDISSESAKEGIHFFGEYIIFDKQVMIKYHEDFMTLEIYIGRIVERHAESFDKIQNGNDFSLDKTRMLQRL